MANGMTPAKRFIVRTALVTGSTLATVVGAQSLATLDLQSTKVQTITAAPAAASVVKAAPSVVILRRAAGQSPVTASTNVRRPSTQAAQPVQQDAAILPPAPVEIAASVQVVQGSSAPAAAPVTRSSH